MKLTQGLQTIEQGLIFLTVLFLPTQLGKHFWPDFSSVYSLRIDYLSPTIYFWDLLVLFLVFTHLIKLLAQRRNLQINKLALSLFSFFLLTQLVSVGFADNKGASFVRLKDYCIAALFGLLLASYNLNCVKKLILAGLLFATIFSCTLGIAQFINGGSLGLWVFGERDFESSTPLIAKFNFYDRVFLRPYATFPHPNMLAGFLVIILPLLLNGLARPLSKFKIMLSLLVSSTVFITFSRPSLILTGVFLAVWFKRFWKLLLIAAVLVSPLIVVRFVSIFTYDKLAVLRREELSRFSIKLFLENPLFGDGLNNFINSLASNTVLVGTSRFMQPVHNIFLLLISETGILGLTGFILMLGLSIYKCLRSSSLLSEPLLSALLAIMFLGLFDHYFLTLPQGQRLLFLIIGLSLAK